MMSARCLSTSDVANTRPCSNFTVVHKRGMFDVEDGKLRLYIVQCVDKVCIVRRLYDVMLCQDTVQWHTLR